MFFDDRYVLTPEAKAVLASDRARQVVSSFKEYLEKASGAPREIYAAAIQYAREKSGAKGRDLFLPVRAALTGRLSGPELDRVFAILGPASARERLQRLALPQP